MFGWGTNQFTWTVTARNWLLDTAGLYTEPFRLFSWLQRSIVCKPNGAIVELGHCSIWRRSCVYPRGNLTSLSWLDLKAHSTVSNPWPCISSFVRVIPKPKHFQYRNPANFPRVSKDHRVFLVPLRSNKEVPTSLRRQAARARSMLAASVWSARTWKLHLRWLEERTTMRQEFRGGIEETTRLTGEACLGQSQEVADHWLALQRTRTAWKGGWEKPEAQSAARLEVIWEYHIAKRVCECWYQV